MVTSGIFLTIYLNFVYRRTHIFPIGVPGVLHSPCFLTLVSPNIVDQSISHLQTFGVVTKLSGHEFQSGRHIQMAALVVIL